MTALSMFLVFAVTSARAETQSECNNKPDCVWVTNGSGAGHCLCKLEPGTCPTLQPINNPDPGCLPPQVALPNSWTCDVGEGPFSYSGPAWDDGTLTGHVVLDERLAICTTRRPKPAPDGKATTTFLLAQLTEAAAAWARAQNYVVDLGKALIVADDYSLELEGKLGDLMAERECLDDVLASKPAVTLADARKLCVP